MVCKGLGAGKGLGEGIGHNVLLFGERLGIWPWEWQMKSPWTHHTPPTVLGGKRVELKSDV